MKICVMGLGRLGSVVAAVYAAAGHSVVGVDVNENIVSAISRGQAPFPEHQLQDLLDSAHGHLTVTRDAQVALADAEATIIIVPTPSREDGSFTNEYVLDALREVALAVGDREHTVIIASTVSPGSCDGVLREALENLSGRSVGSRLGLVYSPEFIALGSIVKDMQFPELVLIGASDEATASRAQELFASVVLSDPTFFPMSLTSAEIAKLAVNTFVTTKISYANMIGELCEAVPTASAVDVLRAVGADSRIGTKYLRPAVGYGGPCFPRDNRALKAAADSVGVQVPIAEATDLINQHQPERTVAQVVSNTPPASRICVLGLAYKTDTPVCVESHGIAVANLLANRGFTVVAHDPMAAESAHELLDSNVTVVAKVEEAVIEAACVLVMTPWNEYAGVRALVEATTFVIDPWQIVDGSARQGG